MAEYGGARQLLPQGPRTFEFANVQPDNRDKQKNYVFVDEHNRHRRLKVMRACGACRRRKIKCDAATTNSWPCAACQKQHLECIPPSSDKDGTEDLDSTTFRQSGDFQTYQPQYDSDTSFPPYSQPAPTSNGYAYPTLTVAQQPDSLTGLNAPNSWTSHVPNTSTFNDNFGTFATPDPPNVDFRPPSLQKSSSNTSWKSEDHDTELSDALLDLKIDQAGVAPYITNQRNLAEGPAVEEVEAVLPASASTSHTASIPPEMMPLDSQALQYIEYFFVNVHPYVPVVNRSYFYRQWHVDRVQISPLILEGIFACSAQMMQSPMDRSRWLALASRHEESFKDVPRLSTVQGMILILKAREAVPKRGYYYRSWMTLQYIISMAKDLGLDEHNRQHVQGQSCTVEDCATRTRIWYTLFQLEMMIGGPQGRTDFSVDMDTINCDVGQAIPGVDDAEIQVAQDQIHMVRLVDNIRRTSSLYTKIRKSGGNFADDPEFVQHNTSYYRWTDKLPPHLQIEFNPDGSAPVLPFHFAANLQCYHWLSVVMHHRPQLNSSAGIHDMAWKNTIITCYSAATKICRLHEAILQHWGLNGLLCMQRGINTAIYTILTCAMLHLVAITSPDPELNSNAKDYFTRHMRILEQCSSSWPMPAIQVQIDSIRQAFSANLNKPFELRPNFPFGSPARSDRSSPPSDVPFTEQNYGHTMNPRRNWSAFDTAPLTPPATASSIAAASDYANSQTYGTPDPTQTYTHAQAEPQMQWDPSAVFDRWTSAFNTAALENSSPGLSSLHPQSTSTSIPPGPTSAPLYSSHPQQQQQPQHQNVPFTYTSQSANTSPSYAPPSMQAHLQQQQQQQGTYMPQPISLPAATSNFDSTTGVTPMTNNSGAATTTNHVGGSSVLPYVTPSMWQDTVARSYGENMKRRWDDADEIAGYKRVR